MKKTNTNLCLALDVGGTNIRMGLIREDGAVILRHRFSCPAEAGLPRFMETLANEFAAIRSKAVAGGSKIVAVGAGIPGLINRDGIVTSSVNLQFLRGHNLEKELNEVTGLRAAVLNDANAAALAEKRYGAGRPFGSLLHFTLGTGVGSGLILDHRLWTGSDGVAAEFGHTTVEPDGSPCPCGNHGCLEQYASARAIARHAEEALSSGGQSSLAAGPQPLDAATVAKAALNGDSLALYSFTKAGRYLGIAAASAVNLLNLDAIILGGGVAASFELMAGSVEREIVERAFPVPAARVKVLKGELGDDAGMMGAAAAAWEVVQRQVRT